MLEVRLLGRFELRTDGEGQTLPSRPAQSLLAYLLLHAGVPQRRERLAGLLWPDHSEASARRNLRTALWHARKVLDDHNGRSSPYILADGITVAFNPESDYWLDVAALEEASGTDCTTAELIERVSLYEGELLPGFYDEWAVLQRDRVEAAFEAAMQRLLGALLAEERWQEVLTWSGRWLAFGRAPEPAYRAQMTAHAGLGDLLSLASTFARCRANLLDELGVEPSTPTVTLYESLIAGTHPSVVLPQVLPGREGLPAAGASEAPANGAPPYRGLQHFSEEDSPLFYGREALVKSLLARLDADPALLVIVGASGSGKSSLVRAGLVPALKRTWGAEGRPGGGGWRVHIITPTAHPLEAAAAAFARGSMHANASPDIAATMRANTGGLTQVIDASLRGTRDRALLLIDQFEELFTLCENETDRRAFVDNLVAVVGAELPLTVVIALRADFYAHCGQYPALREALAAHQAYIGPMSTDELRQAIERPAQRGGWDFSPGLVDLLLRDAGDEPGSLPLLSHALLETWKRRQGHTLTLAGYAATGGVRGAIARTAQWVYQGLSPEEQPIARSAFLRLTALGEATQDTRRRVAFEELVPVPELAPRVRKVLQSLAEARLVTIGDDGIEVAHEALIREWPSLRRWLAEDREGLRLHRRLTAAAREWESLSRDPSVLYRGTRLAQVGEWAEAHDGSLNPSERAFLAAAREHAQGETREREAQRERELQASRQLALVESKRAEAERRAASRVRRTARYLAVALAAAMILAGAAAFLGAQARTQAGAATIAREQAEQQRRLATARELAGAAVTALEADPERSILLALKAVDTTYQADGTWTPEAETALHRALGRSRLLQTLRPRGNPPVLAVADSPDGSRVATGHDDGMVTLWDLASGEPAVELAGHEGPVTDVAFSPNGMLLATASDDKTVRVWAAMDSATAVAGQLLQVLTGHEGWVDRVAFHPDGGMLATSSSDGRILLWDLGSGTVRREHTSSTGKASPMGVAFNQNGSLLAAAGPDNTAVVWDVSTGEQRMVLRGHTDLVGAVNFSPDGTRLVTAGTDRTGRVWDITAGEEVASFTSHTGLVFSAEFSPDGKSVLTGSCDGTVRVWEAATGREQFALAGHEKGVQDASWSPDGTRIVTGSLDGTARIWSVAPPEELAALSSVGNNSRVLDIARDGRRVASADAGGTVRVWDLATREAVTALPNASGGGPVFAVAFSRTGQRLGVTGQERVARIWDLETGELALQLAGHEGPVLENDWRFTGIQDIAYSRDGATIATAGADGTARLWDAETGQQLKVLEGPHARLNTVQFSPDGKQVSAGADDAKAWIWDIESGQPLAILAAHALRVYPAEFGPDGRWLATASADVSARL